MAGKNTARVLDHDAMRRGIHLVKPASKMATPAPVESFSRLDRVGLLPLSIAALAAPTVWCLHEVLLKLHR